jgi:hypothetical protein
MNQPQIFVKSICLATGEKMAGRELACGKFQSSLSAGNFLFYLIELNDSYPNSKVIKKVIQILDNSTKTAGDEILDDNFEKILQNLNEGLARLAESGENSWIGNLNMIVGLIDGTELLMAQSGSITGYIFRKNKISAITEKNVNEANFHPLKTFTDITSGQVSPSDHLIFGNFDLFSRISLDRVRTIINQDNFHQESTELFKYLRRNKAFDVNAIFISITDEENVDPSETPDILYIDAPDETVKKFVEKKLIPAYKFTEKYLVIFGKAVFKASKVFYKFSNKYWHEKIGPKLKNASASIKTKTDAQFPTRGNSNIKIKANSYMNVKSGRLAAITPFLINVGNYLKLLTLKKNRKYLYAILILIFLSLGYWKLKSNNDKKSEKAKEVQLLNSFDKASSDFAKIKEDLALGRTVDNAAISDVLAAAEKAKEIPANAEKASKLADEVRTVLDERTKTVRLPSSSSTNFADGLTSIVMSGNIVYGINTEEKIYSLDTRGDSSKLIASLSSDYGIPVAMTASRQSGNLIIATSKNRLFSLNTDTKALSELIINAEPKTWSLATAIATYSTNIYILSSDNGVVWKHSQIDGGYSKGTSYLDTKKVSIQGAVDFAIDGNIYVLSNEGSVVKFVKGVYEPDFSLKNIPTPNDQILIPKRIFTDEDTNSLFVLDKKLDRIIKFDKSGEYSNQYLLDGQPIDNFVVNAKLQKIWILSGNKIYAGSL